MADGRHHESAKKRFFCPVYKVLLCQLPNNGHSPILATTCESVSNRRFFKTNFQNVFPLGAICPPKPQN